MKKELYELLFHAFEPLRIEYLRRVELQVAQTIARIRIESNESLERYKARHILRPMPSFEKPCETIEGEIKRAQYVAFIVALRENETMLYNERIAAFPIRLKEKEIKVTKELFDTAKKHFAGSITKLTERIEKECLCFETIQVIAPQMSERMDCVISDGVKHIQCQVIRAWGDVQRPHFRLLTKAIKLNNILATIL